MSTDTAAAAAGTSDETTAANSATEERGGAALEPLFVYGVKQGTIHTRRLQKFEIFSVFMVDLQRQSHAILLTFWPTSSTDVICDRSPGRAGRHPLRGGRRLRRLRRRLRRRTFRLGIADAAPGAAGRQGRVWIHPIALGK